MNAPDPRLGRLLLLGENYNEYGRIGSTAVGSQAAAAISVGSDPRSPSGHWKYDHTVANEDAMCLIAAPDWIGMAVADAHYGPEASHMLIERLHAIWSTIRPENHEHLQEMIEHLRQGDPARTDSETTLLVAAYDRQSRTGFGISFGDSTFALAGPDREPLPINSHDTRFVTAASRGSLRHGNPFAFEATEGELLLAFTDGIDGCHYRQAKTSVQPHHIQQIAADAMFDPLQVVHETVALALRGVEGNPGGQDNVVIAAARA